MNKRTVNKQFIIAELHSLLRFSITGIFNVLIDVTAYTILVFLGMQSFQAQPFSISLGLLSSYLLNRRFTFHATGKIVSVALFKYIIVCGICIISSPFLMYVMDIRLGLGEVYAKIPVTVIIGLVNYTLSRIFVFHPLGNMIRRMRQTDEEVPKEKIKM